MEALMSGTTALPNRQIFYGWFVVADAFAVAFVGFGRAYSFSAFLEPLQRDFGASRGEVSLVFSLAGFLNFSLGIITGPLADRRGSRRFSLAGFLSLPLGNITGPAADPRSSRTFAIAGMLLTGGGLVLASF